MNVDMQSARRGEKLSNGEPHGDHSAAGAVLSQSKAVVPHQSSSFPPGVFAMIVTDEKIAGSPRVVG